jgi:WD40 repeat protein
MDTTNSDILDGQNSNIPFGSLLREKECNDRWEMDDIRPKPLRAFEQQLQNQQKDKPQPFGKGKFPLLEFIGHDLPVYGVHQSHFLNSRLVASTSADQTIRLWDTGNFDMN